MNLGNDARYLIELSISEFTARDCKFTLHGSRKSA
jgi:hypothetical protein